MSLVVRAVNSLKKNGIKGSWRIAKNLARQYAFRRSYKGNMKYVPADDGFTGYVPFESYYEDNIDFSKNVSDVLPLAFYLPQFHTFPENDEWWGKGFTEWTNTKKAEPDFLGHYQPRTPHKDIGFYDLSDIETMRRQASLARSHGIYGFCFYYYWFSGKRLMEKPVDMLLQHPEIDINFCLCWANENWTRAWDGQMRDVLIAQEYSKSDPIKFIDDLVVYFNDKRYIRIDGKPVIIAYNCRAIPDIKDVFAKWRERAREIGIGEIVIWACNTDDSDAESLGITDIIDGQVEFPPHNCRDDRIAVKPLKTPRKAHLYNYQKLVALQKGRYENINTNTPVYRCVMSAWDNACRRKDDYTAFYAYSTPAFYEWVRMAVKNARESLPKDRRFMFVNAWNEWAEGTYLEPDEKYGYATINTFSKALFDMPLYSAATPVFCGAEPKNTLKRAVQIHLYFTEEADNILKNVNLIPQPFDCYISTDTKEKADYITEKFKECNADKVVVEVFENRGRDVAPFLSQMRGRIDNYDLVCHIHSKKTTFSGYGDHWREYLYRHLFGSTENINGIFKMFEDDERLGLVFPENYPLIDNQIMFGANRYGCEQKAKAIGIERTLPQKAVFPAGNMFWARSNAVKQMFEYDGFDFASEKGQVNGTDAHIVERLWVYLAQSNGYTYKKVYSCCDNAKKQAPRGVAIYAHYDKDNILSLEDLELLKQIKQQVETLIFVSTSALGGMQTAQLNGIADKIILRENTGFDFTSFKNVILEMGKESLAKVSRLVLCNNSVYTPYKSLDNVFAKMDGKAHFWGVNEFPYCADGKFLGQKHIERHLQSYFMVFENEVLASNAFYNFFESLPEIKTLNDAISFGESRLTKHLNDAGFSDAVLVAESGIAPQYMNSWAVPYTHPYDTLIMGSPFVKKKCVQNMSDEQATLLGDFLQKT